jgi:hypothetical protein
MDYVCHSYLNGEIDQTFICPDVIFIVLCTLAAIIIIAYIYEKIC